MKSRSGTRCGKKKSGCQRLKEHDFKKNGKQFQKFTWAKRAKENVQKTNKASYAKRVVKNIFARVQHMFTAILSSHLLQEA